LRQRTTFWPCHLFALEAISQETNRSMNAWASGASGPVVYIWRSAVNCRYVSGFPGSEEKNTEPTTDFSSTSKPARVMACLTMAWVFCRGALTEVWKRTFRRLPSLLRTPSAPRFHPAASRIWFALSGLNSHFVLVDRTRGGAFRKLAVAWPSRP